jgi:hypothetical protein
LRAEAVDLSRAVSHALRHEPWLYELELDDEGWTGINDLLDTLRSSRPDWKHLSKEDMEGMIALSEKCRHEISGDKIRALYGHSLPGKLKKTAAQPPSELLPWDDAAGRRLGAPGRAEADGAAIRAPLHRFGYRDKGRQKKVRRPGYIAHPCRFGLGERNCILPGQRNRLARRWRSLPIHSKLWSPISSYGGENGNSHLGGNGYECSVA